MRAGLVAVFFFAAVLALGHYVAAPFFCRGGIAIPTLDARALCGADLHLNRSGSVLLYFGAIAIAMFFGILAGLLPSRKKTADTAATAKPAETFESIVAEKEKAAVAKEAPAVTPQPATPAVTPAATPALPAGMEAAIASAIMPAPAAAETKTPAAEKPEEKAPVIATTDAKPAPAAAETPSDPATVAAAEAITVGLAANKNGARKGSFDGTNQELLERFRELRKQEGVNSIAQAQRLLDESTLSALSKGIDPKQHLSDVAHLVLSEDPDLKSGVVRGVVVHIAARLKELGVAKQNLPGAAKGAA